MHLNFLLLSLLQTATVAFAASSVSVSNLEYYVPDKCEVCQHFSKSLPISYDLDSQKLLDISGL